ncbi:MAG TPA: DUF5668 domain-containing protein, partial [Thermoanaerobaculia bacterium]|nr:DUF5668 domain-containing protein [Thermoanaerobaculia bacterium]
PASWPAPQPAVAATAPPPPPVASPPPAVPSPQAKNPAAAGFLSVIPGLGHVYLGLYQRAVIFFAVWVVVMTVAPHGPGPAGLMIPFWWFFVLIDAVRQAKAINATGAPESNLLPNEKPMNFSGSLTFGIFLVLVGLFFLLDRYFRIDLSFLFDFWPVLLIAFGAWQIWAYWKAKQPAEPKEPKLEG